MAIVTLTSAKGSPGVTTTALGLALAWPRDVLLADCDREPGQAVQAGWLQGSDLAGRGMSQLVAAHRHQRPVQEELWLQTVDLDPGSDEGRRYLPGFTHPASVGLFEQIWPELVDGLDALADRGCDVLVDAGRIGRDGLPAPLVTGSDLVLVCVRSALPALAALRLHLPTLQAQMEGAAAGAELGLLVVGANQPYSSSEIQRQFDCPVRHVLPWEPRQARILSEGASLPRGLHRSSLARAHRACASQLAQSLQRRSEVVAGRRDSDEWRAR